MNDQPPPTAPGRHPFGRTCAGYAAAAVLLLTLVATPIRKITQR